MEHKFEKDKIYSNESYDYDIKILEIDDTDPESELWVTVIYIDDVTKGQYGVDEIRIDADEYDSWTLVEDE